MEESYRECAHRSDKVRVDWYPMQEKNDLVRDVIVLINGA